MYYRKILQSLLPVVGIIILNSCTAGDMVVNSVRYQSIRTSFRQVDEVPDDAALAAQFFVNASGKIMVVVYNRSDEILTIDQTKSFFVDTDGISHCYYDSSVYSSTSGSFSSQTSGSSVNLGVLSDILGVGGVTSSILGRLNVNNSTTSGNFNSMTVTVSDMPEISVAPHGKMVMSKEFEISGVGSFRPVSPNYVDAGYKNALLKFSVCISYNFEKKEQEKLVTDFYVNTDISQDVSKGRVGDAFAEIYRQKPDAAAEYMYIFRIENNLPVNSTAANEFITVGKNCSDYVKGALVNYK